ncbi:MULTISPECIES: bifunctional RNase H/acid phosphatase [unclassified Streptomyces]|uniref:bifunctional RNase H/acid phosphatase n=1 Tax=unclassified Streptomyces TaxID=2593676 RepID=UPI001660D639|nr:MULTISPECIES: bifunctional RNase H/acid phosphatase [unclassified Streptomyces]MBD0710845.1 bifunctional RNase H/acid phosphatase [Streptomyces sp. CBMA291]MBD0717741.1 bifunctional RNase H/acid phosphatase [Streptomyces sp. CBMA370]
MRVVVEADGGSRGNPGPAGYGAVVLDPATGETLAEAAEYIGVATNNVAEYKGLIAGLKAARALFPDAEVHVRMDSKLVVEQMSGRWKIKHPDMKPLAAEAARVFPAARVRYEWIPRERNKHADRLANEAMDAGKRGEQWSPSSSDAQAARNTAAPPPSGPPGDQAAGAAKARAALTAGPPRGGASVRGGGTDATFGVGTSPAFATSTGTGVGTGPGPGPGAGAWPVTGPDRTADGGLFAAEAVLTDSGDFEAEALAATSAPAATPAPAAIQTQETVSAQVTTPAPRQGWSGGPDMGAPATFVLLRHGETALTPEKRFSGSGGTDPELSAAGLRQAEAVAQALAARGTVQEIISSPLTRCRQTAAAVAARLGLDVRVEQGLRETDFGAWEGLTFGEVRERYPEDLDAWLASPKAAPTGGGESFATVARRVAATRDRLTATHAGRTVLLVTHVTPIKTLVRLALGAPPESLFRMELSAASISAVAYYGDGNASVRLLNDTSHLR